MLPRNNQRPFILSALTLCMSGAAFAATSPTYASTSDEDTVIVTANRTESSLWDSPATIQVIDRQTLQNSTSVSIADDLQDIPGVEVTDNALAGRKQIRIRGEASSRVLILIDGQVVSYQRAGQNYGAGLLIDESALERIEVVKGPYSVLYGSQAIGGVVNFITKKGGDKPLGGNVKAVYNSATAGWEESATAWGSIGNFDYRINGSYSDQGTAIRLTEDCPTPTSVIMARAYGWVTTSIATKLGSPSIVTNCLLKPGLTIQRASSTTLASKYLSWNARKSVFSTTTRPMGIT